MPGGTALHLAAAALMLKEQFVSPLTGDDPDDLATAPQSLESVHLTRLHCNGAAGRIQLTNPN
jgi:hypothetical protein